MGKDPIVILGAGLAGLSAAYQLEKKRVPYLLFEKEARAGGLVRSEKVNGFTFDYTGHLLHLAKPETRRLILEELGLEGRFNVVARRSFIYSKGVYTRYPFQANTYGLPADVVTECLEGFIEAWAKRQATGRPKPNGKAPLGRPKPKGEGPETFESWILRTFGEGIARHFMRPYNTKLWGVPPAGMTTEWMGRFIPQPSLKEVIQGALGDQKTAVGYNANFLYPKSGGIQILAEAFASRVRVSTGRQAVGVDLEKRRVHFADGGVQAYCRLISTLPLKRFLTLIPGLPSGVTKAGRQLRAVNVFNVNLGVGGRDISDKHWIYVPEERYPFYRVGFCHNFSRAMAPKGCSSLYAEMSYDPAKPFDKAAAFKAVRRGLAEMDLVRPKDRVAATFLADIPSAYVVYDRHRTPAVGLIRAYLQKRGVASTGRWGSWEYGSMEDAIWQGAGAALQGRP